MIYWPSKLFIYNLIKLQTEGFSFLKTPLTNFLSLIEGLPYLGGPGAIVPIAPLSIRPWLQNTFCWSICIEGLFVFSYALIFLSRKSDQRLGVALWDAGIPLSVFLNGTSKLAGLLLTQSLQCCASNMEAVNTNWKISFRPDWKSNPSVLLQRRSYHSAIRAVKFLTLKNYYWLHGSKLG